jgi:hypothetical protein
MVKMFQGVIVQPIDCLYSIADFEQVARIRNDFTHVTV